MSRCMTTLRPEFYRSSYRVSGPTVFGLMTSVTVLSTHQHILH
jgi:hypothetical protein